MSDPESSTSNFHPLSSAGSPFSYSPTFTSLSPIDISLDLDYESLRILQIQQNDALLHQLGLFKPAIVKVVKPRVEKVKLEKSWFSPRVIISGSKIAGTTLKTREPTHQLKTRRTWNSRGLVNKQTNRIKPKEVNKIMKRRHGKKSSKKPMKTEKKLKTLPPHPKAPSHTPISHSPPISITTSPHRRRPQYSQYPPKYLLHTLHPRQILPLSPSPSPTVSFISEEHAACHSSSSSSSTSPTRPSRTSSQVSYSIFYPGKTPADLFDYMRAKNELVEMLENDVQVVQQAENVEKVEKRKTKDQDVVAKRKSRNVRVVIGDNREDRDFEVEGLKFWIEIPMRMEQRNRMRSIPNPVYAKDLPENQLQPETKDSIEVKSEKTTIEKVKTSMRRKRYTITSMATPSTNRIAKRLCDRIVPASLSDTLANCTSVRVGSRYDCVE